MPDPTIGWAIQRTSGGHAGNDAQHASIRRFTSPRDGALAISGKFKHASENGDGVRGRIVSSRVGLLGEWSVKNQETASDVPRVDLIVGDTIDFVVDCVGDVNSDSFEWVVDLKLSDTASTLLDAWNSAGDFHGPLGVSLPAQAAYAWNVAFQRPATAEELSLACRFIAEQIAQLRATGDKSDHELTALTSLCQQLLSSNEFLYVD